MQRVFSTRSLFLVAALSLVTFAVGYLYPNNGLFNRVTASGQNTKDAKDERSAVAVQVIRLTDKGFEPKHIKHTTGQFLLVFQNETSQPLPAIRLFTKKGLADNAAPLNDIRAASGQVFREEFLDLPAGDYVIALPDGKEQCSIRIDEKTKP